MADEQAVQRFTYVTEGSPRERALEARREGLSFVDATGQPVTVDWSQVEFICHRRRCVVEITVAGRTHCLDRPTPAAAGDMDRALRRWWAEAEPPPERAATPEMIAGWLGIEPDGVLRCGVTPWLWLAFLGSVVFWRLGLRWWEPGLTDAGFLFVLATGTALVGLTRVRADVDGLTVRCFGRRRCYAWSEITTSRFHLLGRVVRTTRGAFLLPDHLPGGEKVREAIRRVLAARHEGWRLPTTAPVSDTALSRLTGEATPDERALSVSEDAP
jgi:hypothetical protein